MRGVVGVFFVVSAWLGWYCSIMQRLHRSTLWRRKNKKPSTKGRARVGCASDKRNLELLSRLLYAVAKKSGKRGLESVSMADAQSAPICHDIIRRLEKMAPAGLLVVACWDALRPEVRRRSAQTKTSKGMQQRAISALVADGMPSLDAAKLVYAAGSAEWVNALASGGVPGEAGDIQVSDRPACPSRWFKISRRMINYWRNIECDGEHWGSGELWGMVRGVVRRHQDVMRPSAQSSR